LMGGIEEWDFGPQWGARRGAAKRVVTCNSDIGIALMYHETCVRESFA
jgi:hypothetical protein